MAGRRGLAHSLPCLAAFVRNLNQHLMEKCHQWDFEKSRNALFHEVGMSTFVFVCVCLEV